MHEDDQSKIRLTVCFDMACQNRTIVRFYESEYGHSLMIGTSINKQFTLFTSQRTDTTSSENKIWHIS